MPTKGYRTRANKRLARGFSEFTLGNSPRALKQLERGETTPELAVVTHLTAARAAQQQRNTELRDESLEKAVEAAPDMRHAIDIVRAELQIEAGQIESAIETLVFLRTSAPRNGRVVQLLAGLYRDTAAWSRLDALMPVVHRYDAFTGDALAELEMDCWRGMLGNSDDDRLAGYWRRLPKSAQRNPELLALIAERYLELDKPGVAERMLRGHLNQHWDEPLLAVYSRTELPDATVQLDNAEKWLGDHGRSAPLLLLLGELCLRCQLWGKARVYFESSLGIEESARANLKLADLLLQLGESDGARDHYAKGLRQVLDETAPAVSIRQFPEAVPTEPADESDPPRSELKLIEG